MSACIGQGVHLEFRYKPTQYSSSVTQSFDQHMFAYTGCVCYARVCVPSAQWQSKSPLVIIPIPVIIPKSHEMNHCKRSRYVADSDGPNQTP
jgi:hypothetical protein